MWLEVDSRAELAELLRREKERLGWLLPKEGELEGERLNLRREMELLFDQVEIQTWFLLLLLPKVKADLFDLLRKEWTEVVVVGVFDLQKECFVVFAEVEFLLRRVYFVHLRNLGREMR